MGLTLTTLPKDRFPDMSKITDKIAANTCRQLFFVITTIASTCWLFENFQLNSPLTWIKCHLVTEVVHFFRMAEGSDGGSGETLLEPCVMGLSSVTPRVPQDN